MLALTMGCGPAPVECWPRIVQLHDLGPLTFSDLAETEAVVQVAAENMVEATTRTTDWRLEPVDDGWSFVDQVCGLECAVVASAPRECSDQPRYWYRATFTLADREPIVVEDRGRKWAVDVCLWGEENCFPLTFDLAVSY